MLFQAPYLTPRINHMDKAAAAHSANEAFEVRRRSPQRNERSSVCLRAEVTGSVIRLLSDGSVIGLKTGVGTAVGAVLNSIIYRRVFREHNFLKNISDVAKAANAPKFKKCTHELTHSVN